VPNAPWIENAFPKEDGDFIPENNNICDSERLLTCTNCLDNVPIDPSPQLYRLLVQIGGLIRVHGLSSLKVQKFGFTVCSQIKQDRQRVKYLKRAQKVGWPTKINFLELPKRILQMKQMLASLFSVPGALEASIVWFDLTTETTPKALGKSRDVQYQFAPRVRPG